MPDSALLADRLGVIEDAVDRELIPEPLAASTSPTVPSTAVSVPPASMPPPVLPAPAVASSNANVTAGRTILPRPVHRVAVESAAPPVVRVKQEPGEPVFVIPEHARNSQASPVDVDAYVPGTVEVESESSAGEGDDGEYATPRTRTAGKSAAKVRLSTSALYRHLTSVSRPP